MKRKIINGATVEYGHTFDEYSDLYGLSYDNGDLWDFSIEDFSNGAIETNPNIVYWAIKNADGEVRIYETDIDAQEIHEETSPQQEYDLEYVDENGEIAEFNTWKEAYDFLEAQAKELGFKHYEIFEDSYVVPNGLMLVVYEDEDHEIETGESQLVQYKQLDSSDDDTIEEEADLDEKKKKKEPFIKVGTGFDLAKDTEMTNHMLNAECTACEDYYDDYDKWDLDANFNDDDICVYLFPDGTKSDDIEMAKFKYHLEFLGVFHEEELDLLDFALKGTYANLKEFSDAYLGGYDLHPDYLYTEEEWDDHGPFVQKMSYSDIDLYYATKDESLESDDVDESFDEVKETVKPTDVIPQEEQEAMLSGANHLEYDENGKLIKATKESVDEAKEDAISVMKNGFSEKAKARITKWWKDVEALGKYNIDNGDYSDVEGMHAAMFDMLSDLSKAESEEEKALYNRGRRIYNDYAISQYRESLKEDSDNIYKLQKRLGQLFLPPKKQHKPKYYWEVYWYAGEDENGDPIGDAIFKKFATQKAADNWYHEHQHDEDKHLMNSPWRYEYEDESLQEGYVGQDVEDFFNLFVEPQAIGTVVISNIDAEDYTEAFNGLYEDLSEELLEADYADFDVGGAILSVNISQDENDIGDYYYENLDSLLDDYNGDEVKVTDVNTGEVLFEGYTDELPDDIREMTLISIDTPEYLCVNAHCGEVDESLEDLKDDVTYVLKNKKNGKYVCASNGMEFESEKSDYAIHFTKEKLDAEWNLKNKEDYDIIKVNHTYTLEEDDNKKKESYQIQYSSEDGEIYDGGTFDDFEEAKEEAIDGYQSDPDYNYFVIYDADGNIVYSDEDLDESLKKSKKESLKEALKRYKIEYWVDEDARDQGFGEIAIETFSDLEEAKEFADKLFSDVASVEVLDTQDENKVVYGRYPEDESLKESKEELRNSLEREIAWCKSALNNPKGSQAMDARANYGKSWVSSVRQDLKRFEKRLSELNSEKDESITEARGKGLVCRYKGHSVIDAGDRYVITNEHGLNVGETKFGLPIAKGMIDDLVKGESIKEDYYNKWFDYNPENGWTEEDIAKHKEVDWKARNYEELDVGDEFKGKVYIITNRASDSKVVDDVTFHKFLRPNPIYPPYYKPVDFEGKDLCGPMGDGRTHKTYGVHDRYEDQGTYDLLSSSLETETSGQSLDEDVAVDISEDFNYNVEEAVTCKAWSFKADKVNEELTIYINKDNKWEAFANITNCPTKGMSEKKIIEEYSPLVKQLFKEHNCIVESDNDVYGLFLEVKDKDGKVFKEKEMIMSGSKQECKEKKAHLEEVSPEDSYHNKNIYTIKKL